MSSAAVDRMKSFRLIFQTLVGRAGRREIALFVAGFVLFVAGAANLIVTQQRATGPLRTSEEGANRPSIHLGPVGAVNSVGRPSTEAVGGYVARKKSLLASRAKKEPSATSFAVVSFGSYRTAEQIEAYLRANRLNAKAAILRDSLEGAQPEEVLVTDADVASRLAAIAGSRAAREKARAEELERILPGVSDPGFKAVYQEDAGRHRKAAEILAGGAVWFAVVVEAPLQALSKGAAADGVRLVDIPEEPNVTTATHSFRGILPEES